MVTGVSKAHRKADLERNNVAREPERVEAPRTGAEHATERVQSVLGNGWMNDALQGDGVSSFECAILDTVALTAAGVDVGSELLPGEGSMQAMRDALADGELLPGREDPRLGVIGRGGGHPLPAAIRERMEAAFGHDFSHVRIHTGAQVGRAADALNAHAFAIGPDIYFGEGELAPGTQRGDHLLAHELQHIVQADEGRLPGATGPGMNVSSPNDPHEVEAERVAASIVGNLDVSGPEAQAMGTGADVSVGSAEAGAGAAGRALGGVASAMLGGLMAGAAIARNKDPNAKGDDKEETDKKKSKPKSTKPTGTGGDTSDGGGGNTTITGSKGGGGGGGGTGGGITGNFSGGDLTGQALKAQLTTFQGSVTDSVAQLNAPPKVVGDPKKDGSEDHAGKVKTYEGGIDGIADQIGDLDAFDDLCDAGDDKGKQATALSQIKASKPFKQLSKMWQGALDGGPDSAAMQAAFNHQFDGRGFWGSTEKAFDQVCAAAKAAAKEDAAAAAAKKKKAAAEKAAKNDGKDAAKLADGKGAKDGNTAGQNAGGANTISAEGADAVVSPEVEKIDSYETLKGISDTDVEGVLGAVKHHDGLVEEFDKKGIGAHRFPEIMEQLGKGGSEFLKTAGETAGIGILAHFGDKLVGGAIEKTLGEKVPVVGPLIILFMDPPGPKYWSDVGHGFAKGGKELYSAFDLSTFSKAHSAKDALGIACMKLADLFAGLYDIANMLMKLTTTLSAVALIGGAVLIAVGLALCWLFGVGIPLITAGGWLLEAGEILGDISLALMPVCIALSGIALAFRTAAAFMVPADVYAEQLEGVGEMSEEFGKQAGTKVGLDTARTVEVATAKPGEHGGGEHGSEEHSLEGEKKAGQEKAGELKDQVEKEADALDKKVEEHEKAKADEAKKKTEEHGKDEHGKDEHAKDEHGKDEHGKDEHGKDEHGKDEKGGSRIKKALADWTGRLKLSLKMALDLGGSLSRVAEGFKDLGELAKDPTTSTNRGLATKLESLEGRAKSAEAELEKLGETAEEAQGNIDRILGELVEGEGKLSPEETAELNKELNDAQKAWSKASARAKTVQSALERYNELVERANGEKSSAPEHGEMAHDEANDGHSTENKLRETEKSISEKKGELKDTTKKQAGLEKELGTKRQQLAEAKKAQSEAQKKVESDLDALAEDPQMKAKQEAAAEVASYEASMKKVQELRDRAGELEHADSTQKGAVKGLKGLEGTTLEVNGQPVKVVSVGPKGVVVEPANGGASRTLSPEEISNSNAPESVKKSANDLQKANDTISKATEGQPEHDPKKVADDLRSEAKALERSSRRNSNNKKKQAKWDQTQKQADQWDAAQDKAKAPGVEANGKVEKLEAEVKSLEGDVESTKKEKADLEKSVEDLGNDARKMRQSKGDHRTTEDAKEKLAHFVLHQILHGGEWVLKVTGLEHKLEELKDKLLGHGEEKSEKKPDTEATEETSEKKPEPSEADKKLEGEIEESAKKIGEKEALAEKLLRANPPVPSGPMVEHRKAAAEAWQVVQEKHIWAYKCYLAELAVGQMAAETGTLAEKGKPLKDVSAQQEGPIQQSKSDETQRKQALGEGDADGVEKSDGRMSGIVVDLITKLADNSDRFDKKPDTGGTDPKSMSGAQDEASEAAKTHSKSTQSASDAQQQFLDEALSLREAQEGKITSDITSLENKQREELGIRDEIRAHKAQALAEEKEAREQCEKEAEGFNEEYEALHEWAEGYEQMKEGGEGSE